MENITPSQIKKEYRKKEVVRLFKKHINKAKSKTQLIRNICSDVWCSEDTVRRILKEANLLSNGK